MGFIKDFKAFAMKGSVIDLAVGVIIGGAFGKIVSAMVDDIIMPIVASITGRVQFTDLMYVISVPAGKTLPDHPSLDDAKKIGANVFAYGHFIQTIVDFFIIALFIFIVIRAMARMQRKEEAQKAAEPFGPTATEKLLTEIRDELRKK